VGQCEASHDVSQHVLSKETQLFVARGREGGREGGKIQIGGRKGGREEGRDVGTYLEGAFPGVELDDLDAGEDLVRHLVVVVGRNQRDK